ncbi:MAG: hypothetical protein HQ567_01165 [Candidatus Nealsonbacteria bacterium]|nr:hypothetical protein [Candidatus Nealsonbacteria bacterium]
MPFVTASISPEGAFFQIALAVSGPRSRVMEAAKEDVPPPVVTRGMVDTGASGTAVDTSIIKQLGLTPTGMVSMHTPSTKGTPEQVNQFDVAILILMEDQHIHVADLVLPVIETELLHQGFGVLIGRDVLAKALLIYDGRNQRLTAAF